MSGAVRAAAWHHPDDVSRRLPGDLVPGADGVPLGEGLWNRDLELARHLGHVLTLARTRSVIKAVRCDHMIRTRLFSPGGGGRALDEAKRISGGRGARGRGGRSGGLGVCRGADGSRARVGRPRARRLDVRDGGSGPVPRDDHPRRSRPRRYGPALRMRKGDDASGDREDGDAPCRRPSDRRRDHEGARLPALRRDDDGGRPRVPVGGDRGLRAGEDRAGGPRPAGLRRFLGAGEGGPREAAGRREAHPEARPLDGARPTCTRSACRTWATTRRARAASTASWRCRPRKGSSPPS